MALAPFVLDDLEWKAMVDAIRRRIPAASDGAWTLHSPVDPGVTLLELFAWQLEQRLYRMDQVPETLNRALLSLLGTRARRTRCAMTVLQVTPGDKAASIGRRDEFALDATMPRLVFSARSALSLLKLKPDGVRLWTGARERSADLAAGRVFKLFPDRDAPVVRFELDLAGPPSAGAGNEWLGLWLHLRTAASIAPHWSPDAVAGVPPPARLNWLYRSAGDGSLKLFTVDDGTAGLRRSGVVRLRIPTDWKPEAGGSVYAISLRLEQDGFSAPPRLAGFAANAVVARHARTTQPYSSAESWLPLPGNVVRLDLLPPGDPDKDVPPLEAGFVLCLKERDPHVPGGSWHAWWPVASLHACGPARRAFVVDRERAQLSFGDGLNGRLPVLAPVPAGEANVRLRYLVGGGPGGAVGASVGDDWSGPHDTVARTLTESIGGREAESLADARQRSAALLRKPTRAVTVADFESIARSTPGVAVARAHAAIGRHPLEPCAAVPGAVTVYVVPDVPREDLDPDLVEDAFVAAPVPDPGLLVSVRAELDRARLVGTEVFVSAPRYRAIRLRAHLRGDVHDPAALQGKVQSRLQRFLDPLQGGDAGTGWSFGEPVRAAVMLREVQAAIGSLAQVTEVAIGLDGDEPNESCAAVAIGAHELVWLQELSLQIERGAGTAGGLR